MIMNAFPAIGLSGKTNPLKSTYYLDLGESDHVTFSISHLSNLKTMMETFVSILQMVSVFQSLLWFPPYLTANLLSIS